MIRGTAGVTEWALWGGDGEADLKIILSEGGDGGGAATCSDCVVSRTLHLHYYL